MPRRKITVPKARVIPDTRNADKDFFIPLSKAREMFEAGTIGRDITNNAYFPLKPGDVYKLKELAI